MSTRHLLPALQAGAVALSLIFAAGCKSNQPAPDDATLTSGVQTKLASDAGLANEAIQSSVANGTAVLNGTVDSEAAKALASNDAMQVPGVKGVMNNLTIQPQQSTMAAAMPAQPASSPMREGRRSSTPMQQAPAPVQRTNQTQNNPAPAQPATPPKPISRAVTIPAGSIVPVRITETLDSATTQTGTVFHGSLATDLTSSDGTIAISHGARVNGVVDDAKDATHFAGSALLSLSLNSINGVQVATDPLVEKGAGRGKNTAEKVGGGAAIGAILGGIFGGGKGAAIGAASGGAVGAGANAVTRGQQVQIPSETILRFKLTTPLTVTTTGGAGVTNYNGDATLQQRSNQ